MHRAPAVLAEVNLVDVGVHDVRLLEPRFEDERHDRFLALAPQRAAAVEEIALDQLLRQRAAALLDLPGAHVDEQRAQDRQRVDAVVRLELAVLDGLERLGQQRRHLGRRDDDPVLAVDREDAADQQRVEPEHRHVGAARLRQRRQHVAVEADPELLCRLLLVREAELAHVDVDGLALAAERARPVDRRLRDVAEPRQFLGEPGRGQVLADVQLERLGVDARRQGPAPSLELLRDAPVEHRHQHDRRQQRQQRDDGEAALQLAPGFCVQSALGHGLELTCARTSA